MARRFQFRLAALLRLREAFEHEAERALARAIREEQRVRDLLNRLEKQRQALFELRRSEVGDILDLEFWRTGERFLVALERRQTRAQTELVQALQQVHEAREALKKAHRDHLVLVRLKERRALQHYLEQERLEALLMDELAILRHRSRLSA